MGWYLAGFDLNNNKKDVALVPSAASVQKASALVSDVADKFAVQFIDHVRLGQMMQDDNLSLFILDVRTREEFEAGHTIGAGHAPGGQLVQATDEHIGVRNAHIVLTDDNMIRSIMTASWLIQMNWQHVFVLKDALAPPLELKPPKQPDVAEYETLTVLELDAVLSAGDSVALLDLTDSLDYRTEHIPGAHWIIRSRLGSDLALLPPAGFVIITSSDGRLAHLAAEEVAMLLPNVIIRVLDGGTDAWKDAGLHVEAGVERPLSQTDDVWYKPYDKDEDVRKRMQEYLTWEVGLLDQLPRDPNIRFNLFD